MEGLSALRIELYEELQGLPNALRSDFPDLAVDFLATAFRPSSAAAAAATQSLTCPPAAAALQPALALPPFQLVGPSPVAEMPSVHPNGGLPPSDSLMSMQSALSAIQLEAAVIDGTAAQAPASGWGSLALPAQKAPAAQQQQQSAGGRHACMPNDTLSTPPGLALLVECRRCRKVLLACSALHHQWQCNQQPELAMPAETSASQSEAHSSSSDGVPAIPSASRGSKRRWTSEHGVAATMGNAPIKLSRLSKGGGSSLRAESAEASPSMGEVVEGGWWLPEELHSQPVPVAVAAEMPAMDHLPSPNIHLTMQQRRRRSQHPPRMRRRYLHTHPGRDLPEPLLLNAVARPATGGDHPAGPGPAGPLAPAIAGSSSSSPHKMPPQYLVMPAPAAPTAVPLSATDLPLLRTSIPGPSLTPPTQSLPSTTAGQCQQRQPMLQSKYQDQCRIFQSLLPEQQHRIKQLQRQRAQRQLSSPPPQQQQPGAGMVAQAHASHLPGQAGQPARPGALAPLQQLQLLHLKQPHLQQQQQTVPTTAAMGPSRHPLAQADFQQHATLPVRRRAVQPQHGLSAALGVTNARPGSSPAPALFPFPVQFRGPIPLQFQQQQWPGMPYQQQQLRQQAAFCGSSWLMPQPLPVHGSAVEGIPMVAGSVLASFSDSSLMPMAVPMPQQQPPQPFHLPDYPVPAVSGTIVAGEPVAMSSPGPTDDAHPAAL